MRGTLATALVGILALGAAVAPSGCTDKKGGLMLAVNTDMQVPKDVNLISVTVFTNDAVKFNTLGRVRPDGTVELPSTLAVVEPDDDSATVRIRVMAFQGQKPRVLRDVRTTVPKKGRIALLRIPLNFLDDGSSTGTLAPAQTPPDGTSEFDPTPFVTTCPDPVATSVDGTCTDATIDSSTLPDWDPSLVQTEDQGCFDVAACMAAAEEVTVDPATCTVSGRDPAAAALNLGFRTGDPGLCVKPGECYVPMERGEHGWSAKDGKVQLPPGVCSKVLAKGLAKVVASTACAPWDPRVPICHGSGKSGGDAGAEASTGDGGALPPQGTMTTRALSMEQAGTVATFGQTVYVSDATGLSKVQLSDGATPTPQLIQAIAAGDSILPLTDLNDPYCAFATAQGHMFHSDGATAQSLDGFLSPAGGTPLGAACQGGFSAMFAVDGDAAHRGIYFLNQLKSITSAPREDGWVFDSTPTVIIEASGTGSGASTTYYATVATRSGKVHFCDEATNSCDSGVQVSATPIEGFAASLVPMSGTPRRILLARDGIYVYEYPSSVTTGTIPTPRKLLARDLTGFTDANNVYRPTPVTANDNCVFFGGPNGVEWVAIDDPSKHGYVATRFPGAGAARIAGLSGWLLTDHLVWTVLAPAASGGGMYVSATPSECLGGTNASKLEVGCYVYGACTSGATCCSGTCNADGNCAPP